MPYLTVDDTQLYYEDEGAGQPLLFLHGWGTSGRAWGAQQAELVIAGAGHMPRQEKAAEFTAAVAA